jgi:hypothetical protein
MNTFQVENDFEISNENVANYANIDKNDKKDLNEKP